MELHLKVLRILIVCNTNIEISCEEKLMTLMSGGQAAVATLEAEILNMHLG